MSESEYQTAGQPIGESSSTGFFADLFITASIPEPTLTTGQNEDQLTTYFRMRHRNALDERILAAPICAAPNSQEVTFEFARVSLPTAALAVDWQCWSKGKRPQQPKAFIESTNDIVVLRQELDYDGVEVEGNDQLYFMSAGTYWYAWRKRKQATLSFPVPPYSDLAGADIHMVVVQPDDFVPNVIDAAWPNPAAQSVVSAR